MLLPCCEGTQKPLQLVPPAADAFWGPWGLQHTKDRGWQPPECRWGTRGCPQLGQGAGPGADGST